MAIMSSDIIIRADLRPVWLVETKEKALFHCWGNRSDIIPPSPMVGGHSGGVISRPVAVIELKNGEVREVPPACIRFADGGDGRFELCRWDEAE